MWFRLLRLSKDRVAGSRKQLIRALQDASAARCAKMSEKKTEKLIVSSSVEYYPIVSTVSNTTQ